MANRLAASGLLGADKVAGGYVVRDVSGQALAHVHSRDNEAEARQTKMLTRDEARWIAGGLSHS
jgi:hypothetical protein